MKIIVGPVLEQQLQREKMPSKRQEIVAKIQKIKTAANSGYKALQELLWKNNGKKLHGMPEDAEIFKLRLNDGDRLAYTYADNIDPTLEHDVIVLLACVNHDDQHRLKRKDFYAIADELHQLVDIEPEEISVENEDLDLFEESMCALYADSHNRVFAVMPDNGEADNDKWDKCLSREQLNVINRFFYNDNGMAPALIMGGAGSGKTLVALHILHDFQSKQSETKCKKVYFTQSDKLRKDAEKLYGNISPRQKQEEIDFFDMNVFCSNLLGVAETQLFKMDQFFDFMRSKPGLLRICEENNISLHDVFAEIRGTIKGLMYSPMLGDNYWARSKPYNAQGRGQILNDSLKELVGNEHIFCRDRQNPQCIVPNCDIKKIDGNACLSEAAKKHGRDIVEYFKGLDITIKHLEKENYLSLPDTYGTVSKTLRNKVWNIFIKYQEYLNQNGCVRYDENDLILEMFQKFGGDLSGKYNSKAIDKFDLVVVDEVQDYTELQIYFLYKLCKQGIIVFLGDTNQTVNPTLFSESRIKVLFHDRGNRLLSENLKGNYRCATEIIGYANRLAALRRECIGSGKVEREEGECSLLGDFGLPSGRLRYSKDALRCLIEAVKEKPDSAILVPEESVKREVLAYGVDENQLYTLSEIKGMEYKFVICYGVVEKYLSAWDQILNDGAYARHSTQCRYYFNMLYVAITRAKERFCLIDKQVSAELDEKLEIEDLDLTSLINYVELQESTPWEILNRAKDLEENGEFERAAGVYGWLDKYTDYQLKMEEGIRRCRLKLKRKYADGDGDVFTAVKCSIILNDAEDVRQKKNLLSSNKTLETLVCIYLGNKEKRRPLGMPMSDAIRISFAGFSGEDIANVYVIFLDKIKESIGDSLKTWFSIRKELIPEMTDNVDINQLDILSDIDEKLRIFAEDLPKLVEKLSTIKTSVDDFVSYIEYAETLKPEVKALLETAEKQIGKINSDIRNLTEQQGKGFQRRVEEYLDGEFKNFNDDINDALNHALLDFKKESKSKLNDGCADTENDSGNMEIDPKDNEEEHPPFLVSLKTLFEEYGGKKKPLIVVLCQYGKERGWTNDYCAVIENITETDKGEVIAHCCNYNNGGRFFRHSERNALEQKCYRLYDGPSKQKIISDYENRKKGA